MEASDKVTLAVELLLLLILPMVVVFQLVLPTVVTLVPVPASLKPLATELLEGQVVEEVVYSEADGSRETAVTVGHG